MVVGDSDTNSTELSHIGRQASDSVLRRIQYRGTVDTVLPGMPGRQAIEGRSSASAALLLKSALPCDALRAGPLSRRAWQCGKFAGISHALLCFVVPTCNGTTWLSG